MKPPLLPADESARLAALRHYGVLDTLPEQSLDDLTTLAAQICEAPISLISLVDEHRQWFKSKLGLPFSETTREASFCGHAITQRDLFVVPDTAQDERFADNPLVIADPQVRFYAGVPLLTAEGHAVGTLCVMDCVPRQLKPLQQEALRILGRQVMAQFELRRRIADGQQSEDRLREREEQLRLYAEHSPAAVAMLDRQMRYLVVSQRWMEVYRLGNQPVVGRSHYELFPDLPARWLEVHQRCLAGAIEKNEEDSFPRADGTVDWSHWEIRPWRQADGSIGGIVIFSEDITARKRAAAARRLIEERYRTLFEYAPDGIVIADPNSYYIDANPAICRLLGYARDELIGLHASDIVVPAEIPHIGTALQAITSTGDYHREWRFRRKDGATFAADVMVTTMPDGNLMGVIRDATERNHALEALREAEERMRFVLQHAHVGIWDLDCPTGRLRWSETMEAHYGVRPGAFGGTMEEALARIHPDDRESVASAIRTATEAGSDFATQHRAIWPDGTVRWMSGAGRVLLDDRGEPLRAVGIAQDVTERRTLEEQYQQAQKMEAIGRLAGGVAHDFNNLLTVILGYCDLLAVEIEPADPRASDLAEIRRAGERAAALTQQLLAFSRKQIVEPAVLDLNAITTELLGMLERLIGEDVTVVLELDPALTRIRADRGQIEQIVMNLALNARDAMPDGGTLTIETGNVELNGHEVPTRIPATPGRYVRLAVIDTGSGMTPEVQARLFEPFFTTKESGKGTGLGMATVYGIVTRSGGSIGVQSEVGHGAAVTVYFPGTDATDPIAAPADGGPQARAGSQTILVVDDEEALRELTKRLLEREGYQVLVAADAQDAHRLIEAHPSIDLLLTDIVMPGVGGPELTRQLIERRPDLKVLYMSGYTGDATLQHQVIDASVALLSKPFSSQTLAERVRDLLKG